MERIKVIVNPTAGKGAGASRLPQLTALLDRRKLDYAVVLTSGPWHAAQLATQSAAEGFTVVAAAGGDGTCNEVINGLMAAASTSRPAPALAVLPVGRGNDFAFGAGFPRDLERAVALLDGGRRRPLDVGRLWGPSCPTARFFGNGVGIGFDTLVGLEAARMEHTGGAVAYIWAALKVLATYSSAPLVRLTFDGREIVQRSPLVSLMNGCRMGGAFLMAPGAVNDDGLLDLCMAEQTSRLNMLGLFVRYLRGTQGASRLIKVARAKKFELEALDGYLVTHADGETICTEGTSLRVECVPSAVVLLAPPPTP
jgi:diacylglycerol kinase (ATP)